jgi:hypothetical protein
MKWSSKSAFEPLSHIGSFIAMTPTLNNAIAAIRVNRRSGSKMFREGLSCPTAPSGQRFFGLVHTRRT